MLEESESIALIYILADNIFKHRRTLSDETILPITVHVRYIFHFLTDSQYDDIKFQKLPIYLGVLTQSMDRIDLLKALQQLDTLVQLNQNTAGSPNFSFAI